MRISHHLPSLPGPGLPQCCQKHQQPDSHLHAIHATCSRRYGWDITAGVPHHRPLEVVHSKALPATFGFPQSKLTAQHLQEVPSLPPSPRASNTQPDTSEDNQVSVAHPWTESGSSPRPVMTMVNLDINQHVARHFTLLGPSALASR